MSTTQRTIPTIDVTSSPDRLLPEDSMSSLPETAADWGGALGRMQADVRRRLWSAYDRTVDGTESFLMAVKDRSRRLKEERPMTLLGIITGMAFAAGVGLAVWRSRHS